MLPKAVTSPQNRKENIMTATKDQERKALEQIRKIVEGLGEDSYIGTAFEGCFELAEENIDNDFALSMKEQRDNGQKYIMELETKVATLTKKANTEEANAETLSEELEKSQEWAEELRGWNDEKRERIQELENEKEDLEEKTEAQAQEIMKLKAKLYDFMTA